LVYLGQDGTVQYFNAANGYLAGIEKYPDYVVVSDMALDPAGTLWILNYESRTNLPLIALTRDSVWTYYGMEDGISINSLRRIAVDADGRKWFGSYDNDAAGVLVLDDNGTPWDKQDDPPIQSIRETDGLKSNQVTAFAMDKDGTMWIGTKKGIHYWFGNSLEWRIYLPSDVINDILVDGENNIWVGHDAGLSFRSSEDYSWTHYQAENSGLVSNKVLSLAMDSERGLLYIGTDAGLSRLETPYSTPLASPKELRIYPNPFLPERHGELAVDDLSDDVTLAIFSADGFLIRRYENREVHGRRLFWDGRDDRGRPVPSGLYLIVAKAESGEARTAKAALVR
jgi:ligand-binding sensor domain-containing protein